MEEGRPPAGPPLTPGGAGSCERVGCGGMGVGGEGWSTRMRSRQKSQTDLGWADCSEFSDSHPGWDR